MKVGLITSYGDNCGACLQAHALQKVIDEMGHECEIINYTGIKDFHKQSMKKRIEKISGIKDLIKKIYIKIKSKKTNTKKSVYEDFRTHYLKISKHHYDSYHDLYKNPPIYDRYVCGSDQLWNPIFKQNRNNPAYFLDFVPGNIRKIAYAPSIGTTNIPEVVKSEMKNFIGKIDYLSVREIQGSKIVEELSKRECKVVLDPTLLLRKDYWEKLLIEPNIPDDYILTYIFGEMDYEYEFIRFISEKLGVKVISIPRSQNIHLQESELLNDVGPLEFLGLIMNAKMIITDSFHATIFSLIFNKEFCPLLRSEENHENSMNSRIHSILNIVGLESRIITPNTDFQTQELYENIDYNNVEGKIKDAIEESLEYLKKAIEE